MLRLWVVFPSLFFVFHWCIQDSKFEHCNLEGCDFSFASLGNSIFNGANLRSAKFKHTKVYSEYKRRRSDGGFDTASAGCSFEKCDLTNADFRNAHLCAFSGRTTTFKGATITGADFRDCTDKPYTKHTGEDARKNNRFRYCDGVDGSSYSLESKKY